MPTSVAAHSRLAVSSVPLSDAHAERWSTRAFDPDATVTEQQLTTVLEAARWAPSASNTQPWRFIVARRGTAEYDAILAGLIESNQVWAQAASVLMVNFAKTDASGSTLRWAEYDLGQSVAHLSLQAQLLGLHTHQMGGIYPDMLRELFGLAPELVPVSVTALGMLGSADALPEKLQARELAPRTRLPLSELLL
ncbi:nitroreductase [Salinibacterium sp. dk2585]|uniref:nitroreductase family protein n=1 Tax=unclassified Salinibacterium TaxID=2632331 RepID=UPI0011C24709|nr:MULTISPECIES: nitroreductase family protein [unclassified Salinibacterium]QEE60715.1 nitroreductase [Salinibacterium sp. dk2585]TXK55787.1 nitroreductase [Salinibacterium sp. dk5596]